MRRIVKPAHPDGRIYNPEHANFLPPGGIELEMTPHWLGMEIRGDVISSDIPEDVPEPAPALPEPVAAVAAKAAPKA